MDTGSRLTCLTVVPPDSLLRELKQSVQELSSEELYSQMEVTESDEIPDSITFRSTSKKGQHWKSTCNSSKKDAGHVQSGSVEPDLAVKRSRKRKKSGNSVLKDDQKRMLKLVSGLKHKQRKPCRRKLGHRRVLTRRK